ncbi:hypothetical protein ACTI_26530 [Actinoplanes sp. OR16]|uniref:hypothetical protein n=1 Tax=Actinoplanes sp. OR16 TaxID=946334 RepID=UPI000F6C281E|nr:hypothetical protein [Actinoplanes sp. OR16]BBH65968.1 hypothetical protein ACTI_26530 [Actinoplanes sp. OR16]
MNDDDYGNLLLRPLDTGAPDGPSKIDVAKAMKDGLRVRRVRAWSSAAAVAGVAVAITGGVLVLRPPAPQTPPALPADPALPTACTPSMLPMGDAKSASVNAGDPSGTYLVGTSEPVDGGDHDVLVWRNGKLVAAVPQKSPKVAMEDINASGIAVGSTVAGNTEPYALHDGEITRMKGTGNPVAINDAGVVAGDTEGARSGSVPQRWSSWDAEPELMVLPDGMTEGQAFDITEDGTILTALGSRAASALYLWHADGSIERIAPPKAAPGKEAEVRAIAIHFGWVYAEVASSVRGSAGFGAAVSALHRYEPGSRTWQKLNDDRYVVQVPAVQRRGGGFIQDAPVVYVGDQILRLPKLEKYEDDSFGVTFISEDARVVAGSNMSGIAAERPVVPIIWRCD